MNERLAAEFEEVQRLKGAILARVSHELRTPVCASMLALDAMSTTLPAEDYERCVALLRGQLKRLAATVEDLLFYATLASDAFAPTGTVFDAGEIVAEVLSDGEDAARSKGVRLRAFFSGGGRGVYGDRAAVKGALRQLLSNAVKFSMPGGGVFVSLRADPGPREVAISFADSGKGLDESERLRAFDAFEQLEDPLTRKFGGLGLGLSIVREVARAHGGTVEVSSRAGEGSVFSFRLPAAGLA